MATIKSFTSLEQSKKLAEILPIESADMCYIAHSELINIHEPFYKKMDKEDTPCWSLAALLEQIPYELCDDDGNSSYLQINKEDDVYQLVYEDPYGDFESVETNRYEHFIDACVEMVIKLHELNLL